MAYASLLNIRFGERNSDDAYEDLIVKFCDRPSHILPKLGSKVSLSMHEKIFELEERNREGAVRMLIKELQKTCGIDWVQTMKTAVRSQNKMLFEWLDWEPQEILEKIQEQAEYRQLMLYYFTVFINVNVNDVTNYFLQCELISERDVTEVMAVRDTKGTTRAMQDLLLRLPKKEKDWFVRLIRAMQVSGHKQLLDKIDNKFWTADNSIAVENISKSKFASTRNGSPEGSKSPEMVIEQPANGKAMQQLPKQSQVAEQGSADARTVSTCSNTTAGVNDQTSEANNYSFTTMNTQPSVGDDVFYLMISRAMSEIEEDVRTYPDIHQLLAQVPKLEKLVQLQPDDHGTDNYTNSVQTLKRETAKIFDQNKRHFFTSCSRHLMVYNKALMINVDCRAKDALDYLKKELKEVNENLSMANDIDQRLDALYTDMKTCLEEISKAATDSEQLQKLRAAIMDHYLEDRSRQGIILCRSTEVGAALVRWMKETATLASLNPYHLAGKPKTTDIRRYFRGGQHKVIVASHDDVKGLDISKCDYSLLHDHVTPPRAQTKITRKDDRRLAVDENAFELRCLKCQSHGVLSENLRTIAKTHHVVIDDSFDDRVITEPHPNPKKYRQWERKGKILCKSCRHDWGVKAVYNGEKSYLVLTVASFDVVGHSGDVQHYRDWKEFPFAVLELDSP